jgi:threonine aldolase
MGLVNLYSDTQTRPSSAMRTAMAEAEVGDEQRFEDPQVTELCLRVASLLGMDAAVFLPSGTMCNEIAFRLHIRPGGDEAILHRMSHPIIAEAGGPAAFAGAMMQPLDTPRGMFTGDDVRGALRRVGDRYMPRSRLVSVEQTTNMSGGRVWPLEQLRDVVSVAREAGLRLHMDGARLMNAVRCARRGSSPRVRCTRSTTTWSGSRRITRMRGRSLQGLPRSTA